MQHCSIPKVNDARPGSRMPATIFPLESSQMHPIRSCCAIAALAMSAAVAAQHAHEHGVADLRIAVDGATLLVEFDSPLANLVGFEHAPRDAAQREALSTLAARLREPQKLLSLPAAAQCEQVAIEIEVPGHEDEHGHGHDHDKHGHDKHDHGHAHDHADEHADAFAAWEFRCENIDALDAVELGLIEAFPTISTLRVNVAAPGGQSSRRVSAARERVAL
tara:strand:+ start:371 stop:1030 length:660 start_codon:yes stop_codon:yes gene_type:complete